MKTTEDTYVNIFDYRSEEYSKFRIGYPERLFEDIKAYGTFNDCSDILEIGAGSGIASKKLINIKNTNLTLIEPGYNFCKLLNQTFKNNKNVCIINTTFENFFCKKKYDMVVAANSFHWIDPSIKYWKSFELLRDNGYLIAFWNNYMISDKELYLHIEDLYKNAYLKNPFDKKRQQRKISNRKKEMISNGLFSIAYHKIYEQNIELPANHFLGLMSTFINCYPSTEPFKTQFNKLIKKEDKIMINIRTNLEIAKKN